MHYNAKNFLKMACFITLHTTIIFASHNNRGRYDDKELLEIQTSVDYYKAIPRVTHPELFLESLEMEGKISRDRYRRTLANLEQENIISHEVHLESLRKLTDRLSQATSKNTIHQNQKQQQNNSLQKNCTIN